MVVDDVMTAETPGRHVQVDMQVVIVPSIMPNVRSKCYLRSGVLATSYPQAERCTNVGACMHTVCMHVCARERIGRRHAVVDRVENETDFFVVVGGV